MRKIFSLIVLVWGAVASAQPLGADVVVLAGQSNMQGSGQVAELPEAWRGPVAGAMFWTGEAFEPLVIGETVTTNPAARFGPELGVMRVLSAYGEGREVFYVKLGLSGQPLDAGWDGNRWAGDEPGPGRATFYPGESADDANVGRHYARLLARTGAAFEALRAEGYAPRLRAVVWMQGEQDAKHAVSAARYAASLARLKRRLEEDLGTGGREGGVPFVFGQVLAHDPPLERFTHWAELRSQMAAADFRSGEAGAVPGVWMVPMEGVQLRQDTVHYTTRGVMMMGELFGLTVLAAEEHASGAAAGE